jgi:hypothetical protein
MNIYRSEVLSRSTWFVSRVVLFCLLEGLNWHTLSWMLLGWTACEASRWEHERLLAWYRQFLPTARLRLEKLDALQELAAQGYTLQPSTPVNVRNTRQEIAEKMKLLRMPTHGKNH